MTLCGPGTGSRSCCCAKGLSTPEARPGRRVMTRGFVRSAAPGSLRQPRRPTFESDYETVLSVNARRDRLDAAITLMAADSEFTAVVHRLGCLRGVSTLTGFALAVEIGDWDRFTGASIGSFVGLTPSEYSSGASRVQGSITKTGNSHVRRLLVEAAWHHRPRYVAGKTMRGRWELAAPGARVRGDAGKPTAAPQVGEVRRPQEEARDRERGRRPRTGRLVLVPGRHGRLTTSSWLRRTAADGRSAWSDPRFSYEQPASTSWRRSTLDTRSAPAEHPVLRYPTRAYQPDRASPTTRSPPTHRRSHEAPDRTNRDGRLTLPLDRNDLHIS